MSNLEFNEVGRQGAVDELRGFEFTCRQMGVEPIAEQVVDLVLRTYLSSVEAWPVQVDESDFNEKIRIAMRRYGKHSDSPASEITEFLVDAGVPIELSGSD